MQELTLPNKEGKRVLYPRMRLWQQVNLEEIAQQIHYASSFTPGDIIGLVHELGKEIARQMGEGKSVKIEGLGVFSPSLGLRQDKERESGEKGDSRRNASSLCLRKINFRADKQLLYETSVHCSLERSSVKFARSSQKFTPNERLKLAQSYLTKSPYLQVSDYCKLTGLLRNSAAKELRQWATQPETDITTRGRGSHKMYVKQ